MVKLSQMPLATTPPMLKFKNLAKLPKVLQLEYLKSYCIYLTFMLGKILNHSIIIHFPYSSPIAPVKARSAPSLFWGRPKRSRSTPTL